METEFINNHESTFSLATLSKGVNINSETARKWMTIIEKSQSVCHTVKLKEVESFTYWEKITTGYSLYIAYKQEFKNNNRNLFG